MEKTKFVEGMQELVTLKIGLEPIESKGQHYRVLFYTRKTLTEKDKADIKNDIKTLYRSKEYEQYSNICFLLDLRSIEEVDTYEARKIFSYYHDLLTARFCRCNCLIGNGQVDDFIEYFEHKDEVEIYPDLASFKNR